MGIFSTGRDCLVGYSISYCLVGYCLVGYSISYCLVGYCLVGYSISYLQ